MAAGWPATSEEYGYYHLGGALALLLLNAPFGVLARRTSSALAYAQPQALGDLPRQLGQVLWSRAQGELALVGLIGVWIWLAGSGALVELSAFSGGSGTGTAPGVPNGTAAGPAASGLRRLGDGLPPSPPAHEVWWRSLPSPTSASTGQGWPPHLPSSWWGWPIGTGSLTCDALRGPAAPAEFLQLTGDVQLALFLAMLAYFGSLWLSFTTLSVWVEGYTRLELGDATPRSPAERSTLRRLDAMRGQLLAAARSDPRVAASGEQVKASVDEGRLYVSGFVAQSAREHAARLCDFSAVTWTLILLYIFLLASALNWCAPFKSLLFWFDVVWYASSTYLFYRLVLHGLLLRHGARQQHIVETTWPRPKLRTGWPQPWWDRLTFVVVGPGVAGFVPCRARPSPLVGARCVQAMLWLHFYRLGQYLTDPFVWHAEPLTILWDMGWWVGPKLLCLGVWALYIVPGLVEVWSLPPFLDERGHALLLGVIRDFPAGRPPTGHDGAPTPHGAARAPVVLEPFSPLQQDRGLRRAWRWLVGTAPPPDSVQRLADHATWIQEEERERSGAEPRAEPRRRLELTAGRSPGGGVGLL